MNKYKLLKWLNDEISMYEKRIEERKGPNYHDESERILRFEERLGEAIRIKEHIPSEQEETCEYCQGEKSLSEREIEPYSDIYTGFGVDISGENLLIESCTAVGRPSRDYTFSDKEIEIKFCPMCGRKIKAGE